MGMVSYNHHYKKEYIDYDTCVQVAKCTRVQLAGLQSCKVYKLQAAKMYKLHVAQVQARVTKLLRTK